jgi:hypothetical protein
MHTADLQAIADRHAIADLISGLGLWLDEKRFDEARSILSEDVTVDSPAGSTQGIDRVADQARRNHDVDTTTQHVITNILIELAGDEATASANVVATFVERAGAAPYSLGARYRLGAVREPEGWRLSRVQVTPAWSRGSRPIVR